VLLPAKNANGTTMKLKTYYKYLTIEYFYVIINTEYSHLSSAKFYLTKLK